MFFPPICIFERWLRTYFQWSMLNQVKRQMKNLWSMSSSSSSSHYYYYCSQLSNLDHDSQLCLKFCWLLTNGFYHIVILSGTIKTFEDCRVTFHQSRPKVLGQPSRFFSLVCTHRKTFWLAIKRRLWDYRLSFSWYLHLNMLSNIAPATFCLNAPMWLTGVSCWQGVSCYK